MFRLPSLDLREVVLSPSMRKKPLLLEAFVQKPPSSGRRFLQAIENSLDVFLRFVTKTEMTNRWTKTDDNCHRMGMNSNEKVKEKNLVEEIESEGQAVR